MASRSWNKVELIGNLTRDPEMRYTPSGAAVVTFSVATNRSYVTDGERKEEVDFHRCVAWNKLAEICHQFLKKGTKVFVAGRLQNRQWEDQQSGQTRYITEIVLDDMIILSSRGSEGGDYSSANSASSATSAAEEPVPARQADEMPKDKVKRKAAESEPQEGRVESVKEAKIEKPAKEEVEDSDDLPF